MKRTVANFFIACFVVFLTACQEDNPNPLSAEKMVGQWSSDCQLMDTTNVPGLVAYQKTVVEFTLEDYFITYSGFEDSNCVNAYPPNIFQPIESQGRYFIAPNHFHTPSGLIAYALTFQNPVSDERWYNHVGRQGSVLYFAATLPGSRSGRDLPDDLDVTMQFTRQ